MSNFMYPFQGQHRCNHPSCGRFGTYYLLDWLTGMYAYACKRHKQWMWHLAYGNEKEANNV